VEGSRLSVGERVKNTLRRKYNTQDYSAAAALALYSGWLGLTILAAWVAWQLHTAMLYLVAAWLQSDLPVPVGWTSEVLPGLSRLSVLVWGAAWLIWILYLEGDLQRHRKQARLGTRLLQIFLGTVALLAATYAIVMVVG
jgi:hypothetical protein